MNVNKYVTPLLSVTYGVHSAAKKHKPDPLTADTLVLAMKSSCAIRKKSRMTLNITGAGGELFYS
jgi:hypothetical protein